MPLLAALPGHEDHWFVVRSAEAAYRSNANRSARRFAPFHAVGELPVLRWLVCCFASKRVYAARCGCPVQEGSVIRYPTLVMV
jgi:hypothetical protein